MKSLKICIGSACHLKGSYEVIEIFKRLIREKGLEEELELKAVFCLGNCTQGVSTQRWDGEILPVSIENAEAIFENSIASLL